MLCFPSPALAEDAGPIVVTQVELANQELLLMPLNGNVAGLADGQEVSLYSGWSFMGDVSGVAWQYEAFDAAVPGRQALWGEVLLPEGYVYAEDVSALVEQQVLVYDPAAPPTEEVTIAHGGPALNSSVVPLGCTEEELSAFLAESDNGPVTKFHTADSLFIRGSYAYSWDAAAIDTEAPGVYTPYRFTVPPGTFVNEANHPVRVVDPNEVDLHGLYIMLSSPWLLECFWLRPIAEQPVMWLCSVEDEHEVPAAEDWQVMHTGMDFLWDPPSNGFRAFVVYTQFMQPGLYWLQVRHNDGESEPALVKIDAAGVTVVTVGGDRTGTDRDGGDRPGEDDGDGRDNSGNDNGGRGGGNTNPPGLAPPGENDFAPIGGGNIPSPITADSGNPPGGGAQANGVTPVSPGMPAQENDTTNSNQPIPSAPPLEYENEATLAISGRRLAALIEANPEGVAFVKQGLRVVVNAQALKALALGENQLFTVTIEQTQDGAYIHFSVDGVEVELPYTLETLYADAEANAVAVQVQLPPDPGAQDGAGSMPLYVWGLLAAGGTLLLAGAALFLRRRAVRG